MNTQQLQRMRQGKGFVAALDQSGGSTPQALRLYGIDEKSYRNEEEMLGLVHEMRKRIVMSPAFSADHILGAILFENTLQRTVAGRPTADYLWEEKGIVPFLKVDKGLADLHNGVQLMKPMPGLDDLLKDAVTMNVFGTKMRSVIKEANPGGIAEVVGQQFDVAKKIIGFGLIPIIEPEVDIHSPDRRESEAVLLREVRKQLARLPDESKVMFKFSLPVEDNLYKDLLADKHVVRIVALSGGFSRAEANDRLKRNNGVIASFSRALTQGLNVRQSDAEFNSVLSESIRSIYEASIT